MKKMKIEMTYDYLTSTYGVEDDNTAILIVVKNPNAGALRVMVNEIEAADREALLEDWDESWTQMGMRVKQEILRRPGESVDITVIDEAGNIDVA